MEVVLVWICYSFASLDTLLLRASEVQDLSMHFRCSECLSIWAGEVLLKVLLITRRKA